MSVEALKKRRRRAEAGGAAYVEQYVTRGVPEVIAAAIDKAIVAFPAADPEKLSDAAITALTDLLLRRGLSEEVSRKSTAMYMHRNYR